MLEESTSRMEKKSHNRSSQTQSRASGVDCKKNSDLTHNKPWLRNNKKRETASGAPKNEPYRKSLPPTRGRGPLDRRPPPRGNGRPNVGGTADAGLVEDEPELGSVLAPGSKKQSLNHLLNFMYTPRSGVGQHRSAPPPVRRYNSQTCVRRQNQDLYLQASCQFVLKECGDYTVNLTDPDVRIDWNQIEEIVLRGNTVAKCPICLCEPVAGRVGHCGHPICWACALHYTDVHEQRVPPCPVCLGPLPLNILKPARSLLWEQSSEELCFRLVRRLRGSTVVEVAPPRGQIADAVPRILAVDLINESPFSKLFTANDQQVQNILERERKELQDQILAEIDVTEVVYLEQALDMLKFKEDNYKNLAHTSIESNITPIYNTEAVPIIYEKQTDHQNTIDWFDFVESDELSSQNTVDVVSKSMEKCDLNPEIPDFEASDILEGQIEFPMVEDDNDVGSEIDKENRMKYFYFYQATDGQEIFLHNINVRMLNATWGSMQAGPATIRGKVLRREGFSLTDQQRKHMPCATHLPLHCPIEIVELDLKPPYVTKQIIKSFSEELDRRAKARARVKQKERRRERAYQLQMEGPMKPDFSSETQFPPTSPSNYTSPPIQTSLPDAVENVDGPSTSGTSVQSPSGFSFAQMASTSGVWKVRPVKPVVPVIDTPQESDSALPHALNLSDAIEAALLTTPTSTKGRNKKSKKKVLFATGLQHAA